MAPLAPPRLFTSGDPRLFLFSLTTAASPAFANVVISVNKNTQQMSVSVDGVPRYRYRPNYGWERPTYGDAYRPDYGGSDYYWRPEPRTPPFFNPY